MQDFKVLELKWDWHNSHQLKYLGSHGANPYGVTPKETNVDYATIVTRSVAKNVVGYLVTGITFFLRHFRVVSFVLPEPLFT